MIGAHLCQLRGGCGSAWTNRKVAAGRGCVCKMGIETKSGTSMAEFGRLWAVAPAIDGAVVRRIPPGKRLFDIAVASAALVFFAPFLLLVAGLILAREGGPVFFLHERIGQGGRPFRCIKFRTMVKDADARLAELLARDPAARAEWQATQKLANDPRINCLGAFLRKTSLDELPQFLNVLKGDMSVVGPRPVVIEEAHHYGVHFADYIAVRPGVTGAWQVSGRSETTYAERVALDVEYVRNAGLWRDIVIVLKTVKVVLAREGAR